MSQKLLGHTAKLWFAVAALGQLAFVYFILGFYGTRTLRGDFPAWNDKPIITGYVPGDRLGNTLFALHVLLGGLITLAGLLQLIPQIRQKMPRLHVWNGRLFLLLAVFMTLDGLWKIFVRGSILSQASSYSSLLGAALILLFCAKAYGYARQRRLTEHRRWALRAFLAVSGVWFFRVGLMAWILINRAPIGMNDTLSGPMDILIGFASYLLPLACLEMYFAAQLSSSRPRQIVACVILLFMTAVMAIGIVGAAMMLWWPYL